MLVGQQPFVGPDVNSILHQVMNGEPPPLGPALAPLLPGQVEGVLRKALSKRQIDRYPTITAFAKAFEAAAPLDTPMRPVAVAAPPKKSALFVNAAAPPAPRPAPSSISRGPRRWTFVVAALLATALGVGIALYQSGQLPWRSSSATSAGDDGAPAASPAHTRKPGDKKRRPAGDR
jgi:serine/threonine-protein kinase